jgi:CheY-like chemotaxis protein
VDSPVLLHVEDDLDDRILFQQAHLHAGVSFRLFSVEHGQAAMDYLRGAGPYGDRARFPVADAVLLDLKMPVPDGFTVLHWIRAQIAFRSLPVFVFSSSYQHADIERAYSDGATAFFTKASDFESLVRLAAALQQSFGIPEEPSEAVRGLREYKPPRNGVLPNLTDE